MIAVVFKLCLLHYTHAVGDTGKGIKGLEEIKELLCSTFASSKAGNQADQTAGTFGVAVKSAILYARSTMPSTSGVLSVVTSSPGSFDLINCDITILGDQPDVVSCNVQTSPKFSQVSGTKMSITILGDLERSLGGIKNYFSALSLLNLPISFTFDVASALNGRVPLDNISIQDHAGE